MSGTKLSIHSYQYGNLKSIFDFKWSIDEKIKIDYDK